MQELAEVLGKSEVVWWMVGSFWVGSIPFGLIVARVFAGTDVRQGGSRNIGASNVTRLVGKKLGALTLALDAAKGWAPVLCVAHATLLVDDAHLLLVQGLVGLCAVLGHCFSPWLRFRGGKGVATGLGFMLGFMPDVALIGAATFAIVVALTRLPSLGSLLAVLAVILAVVMLKPLTVALLPLAACILIVVAKHHENLRRLLRRKELSIS